MSRFKAPDPENLTEEQRPIEQLAIDQMFRAFPQLEYKDENGTLMGPYPSLYYTPDLVRPFFGLANAVVHQARFTPLERELAVLAVLATTDSPYPLYAHSQIALACGLSPAQIRDAVSGTCPAGLPAADAAVYEAALLLAGLRAPLGRDAWERAVQGLGGQERLAGLGHLVAAYAYVGLLANMGDCAVPAPREGVFLAEKAKRE